MFSVRGKFKDGYTFGLTPVTANDAKAALAYVMDLDEIKSSEHGDVIAVFVKKLESRKKIRISDKPAAARKGPKPAAPAAPAAPATPTPAKRR